MVVAGCLVLSLQILNYRSHETFKSNDHYNDESTIITNLIKMRARGGNYLANMAPGGEGAVPVVHGCRMLLK
ncbi:hypothetical protein [Niabella hirudinis]|uniref:hypothetical protein n=1 Tax=Niabella hirudinis TaxID=1285929 RepID=UPI003EBFB494